MPRTVEEALGQQLARLRGCVQAINAAIGTLEEEYRAAAAVDLEAEDSGAAGVLRSFVPPLDDLCRGARVDLARVAQGAWNIVQSEQLAVQQAAARRAKEREREPRRREREAASAATAGSG